MKFVVLSHCVVSAAVLLLASACATRAPAPIEINLVAINDLHGNLESSRLTYTSLNDKTEQTIQAGGLDTVAAALQAWRKEDPQLLLVGAGDLVGASPAISSMWADEPTIAMMNMLDLRVTSVGNHEFDAGRFELLRQQNGGCVSPRPDKACQYTATYDGAKFTYLAANVLDKSTGKPFMPAYRVVQSQGVKIGFIGAVLKGTADVALASGIAGLDFVDEADAVNRVLPELRAQGVNTFVVLIHQGGSTEEYFDQPDCAHLTGAILPVLERLDPAIGLVISGHSHHAYTCRVDGRLVTQADMGGHMLSRIQLRIDRATGAMLAATARNVIMRPGDYPADPKVDAYLAGVRQRSVAALARPVARLAVPVVARARDAAEESALGDLVADANLAATRHLGAQIGLMNWGGMRQDLVSGDDMVTDIGQTQAVLPFNSTLVVLTLSGAQIRALLEEQWSARAEVKVLAVSKGFTYRWDQARLEGQRVVPGSIRLNGHAIEDRIGYRVAINNFLGEGGDGFPTFLKGSQRIETRIRDIDALRAYLVEGQRSGAPAGAATSAGRIQRIN